MRISAGRSAVCSSALGMPALMMVLAPGFADDPQRYGVAVQFARITFPYLMLMSLTALMGGVLNAVNRFGPFAAAPILFNLTLIAFLLFAAPYTATGGHRPDERECGKEGGSKWK